MSGVRPDPSRHERMLDLALGFDEPIRGRRDGDPNDLDRAELESYERAAAALHLALLPASDEPLPTGLWRRLSASGRAFTDGAPPDGGGTTTLGDLGASS